MSDSVDMAGVTDSPTVAPTNTGQQVAGTCPECLSPFQGSHFGDCRISNGMKPSQMHRNCGADHRSCGAAP